MRTYLITGSCGFIGCNLALSLLKEGHKVIGVDLVSERHSHARKELEQFENFKLYDIDLKNKSELDQIPFEDIDFVFHLAANADVRFSSVYPEKDLNDGIVATYNLLRWIKEREIKKFAYASTSAIYGDPKIVPTPEDYSFTQTSFYGASKLAGEGLIQAHCAAYDAQAWIFRYCSITGPRYSHGFIYNFYQKLKADPNNLFIHGGKDQRKTYLDVEDCVSAMKIAIANGNEKVNTYNVGNFGTYGLLDSLPVIIDHMKVSPKIVWSGNEVGWVGDSKINHLDVNKLLALGWEPKYSIKETIVRTLEWLDQNQWILEVREEL